MLYVIEKDGKYFNSNRGYINTSGSCSTPGWGSLDNAMGTSSIEHAQAIANIHGGQVVPYRN